MLFSCKISSAVLSFLESQGEDISSLLERTPMPEEFLRDPSYWMDASEMESFLLQAQAIQPSEDSLFLRIGHAAPQLRSWGVLDSVLRMMPNPYEILAQPQRFMSYFVSPEPPVLVRSRSEASIEIDIPIDSQKFPMATQYLKAAFESLPVYSGHSQAQCDWNGSVLRLQWNTAQSSLFEANTQSHQLSPDFLQSVVDQLEGQQRELERRNRSLEEQNAKLTQVIAQETLRSTVRLQASSDAQIEMVSQLEDFDCLQKDCQDHLESNLARLSDYMVRAQQLITMLVGQDRLHPSVQQAMKRTDWDFVKEQFPILIQESRDILRRAQAKKNQTLSLPIHHHQSQEQTHV